MNRKKIINILFLLHQRVFSQCMQYLSYMSKFYFSSECSKACKLNSSGICAFTNTPESILYHSCLKPEWVGQYVTVLWFKAGYIAAMKAGAADPTAKPK